MILAQDIGQRGLPACLVRVDLRKALVVQNTGDHAHHGKSDGKRADIEGLGNDSRRGGDHNEAEVDADHDFAKPPVSVPDGGRDIKNGRSDGEYSEEQKDRLQGSGEGNDEAHADGQRGGAEEENGEEELAAGDEPGLNHAGSANAVFLIIDTKHMIKKIIGEVGYGEAEETAEKQHAEPQPHGRGQPSVHAIDKSHCQGNRNRCGNQERRPAGSPPGLRTGGSRRFFHSLRSSCQRPGHDFRCGHSKLHYYAKRPAPGQRRTGSKTMLHG